MISEVASLLVAAWHMGALHGYERLLVALVAFGPFVVLGVVVHVVRRRDLRDEAGPGVGQGVSRGAPPATRPPRDPRH